VKPRNWRLTMTVAITASLVLGLVALGFGIEDLRKVNNLTHSVDGLNGSISTSFARLKAAASTPAASIVTPANGSTVSGKVGLDASPIGSNVAAVSFVATGGSSKKIQIARGTVTLVGFGAVWSSSSVPNGTYQIAAVAYSSEGKSTTSPAITVTVSNPSGELKSS
jgi:hypothetical protein